MCCLMCCRVVPQQMGIELVLRSQGGSQVAIYWRHTFLDVVSQVALLLALASY